MIVEILVVSALLSAVWVGSGKVQAARPYRAGVAGAARASWSAGSTVARDRWATGAGVRATRRQARAARWGQHWYGRATLRAEHGLVRPMGRGLAVAGPAAWAGAKAARAGFAEGYRAEKERRATGPTAGPTDESGPADGPTVDQVGHDDSSPTETQPTDQPRPTLTAVPTTEETTVPTTEIPDLQSLVAVLTGIEALAEQMADVSQAARATHETALMEFDFNPGGAVASALNAASEAAPQWFDADAWLSAVSAARREAEALMSKATEIADTGAAGRLDQLAAS